MVGTAGTCRSAVAFRSAHARLEKRAGPTMVGREALRDAEVQMFDLIAEGATPKERAELLEDPLRRATRRGERGLVQTLVIIPHPGNVHAKGL